MKKFSEQEKEAYVIGKKAAEKKSLLAGFFILIQNGMNGDDENLIHAFNTGYESYIFEKGE